jgi:hypothetical protein
MTAGAAAMSGPALAATRLREPIDVAPFLAWCAERETRIRRELGSEHGVNDGKQTNHRERLVTELGWTIEAGCRRLHRWTHPDQSTKHSGLVERAVIEDALHNAGVQFTDVYPDLDTVTRLPSGRRRPSNAGIPITVPEDVLIEAHRLHLDEGYSLRQLGRTLHHRTFAKTPEALTRSLENTFRQRGWETIGHREAMIRFNRAKVAHLPLCTHIHQAGPHKGQRCARHTSSGTCWHHNPERLATLQERFATAKANRTTLAA